MQQKAIVGIIVLMLLFSVYKTFTGVPDSTLAERTGVVESMVQPMDAGALAALRSAAEKGDRMAQYELGLIYAKGTQVKQDFAKAHDLLKKAAMQGVPKAQYHLGEMYVWGDGVEVNYPEAIVWFWLGTSLGDKYAQKRLRAMTTRIDSVELANAKARVDELWKIIPHDLSDEMAKAMH